MHLHPFELHRPASVDEVVALARTFEGKFDYLAGGTDLLPNYKMHLNLRPHLVALEDVEELRGRSLDRVGAMERLADLEGDGALLAAYPPVGDAVREIATPLVRSSGTVGGNLLVETRCFFFNQSYFWRESLGFCLKADGDRCHVVPQATKCYATFSGDLAPALMSVDAEVEVAGPGGRRRLPLDRMYDREGDGIHRLTLRPGDLVVGVHLPAQTRGRPGRYLKLRVRPSFDFPELGVAASGTFEGDRVRALRVAIGGAEMAPKRYDALTEALVGQHLSEDRLAAFAREVEHATRPVHNTFLLPDYRRRMVSVYVRRAVRAVREGSGG